jgi:hypothetical protein
MHRLCVHAFGGPNIQSSIANGLVRRYASTAAHSLRLNDAATVTPRPTTSSKNKHSRRPSKSRDRKQSEFTASDNSRNFQLSSKKPSRKSPKKKPEPAFRSQSVWEQACTWVPRRTRHPEVNLEADSKSVSHPLLLQDEQLPGEWPPTPAKGVDPMPLKRLLLRDRPSADQALQALTESQEDHITTVSGDLDWIEMSFAPGTFVEVRR